MRSERIERRAAARLRVAAIVSWLRDLLHGLFPLPTADAPAGCDYAAAIEERYSKPRRCC